MLAIDMGGVNMVVHTLEESDGKEGASSLRDPGINLGH